MNFGSGWGILGGIAFGSIGFVAFMYGKKQSRFGPLFLGLALMGYSYFVHGTIWIYLVGIVLTTALFLFRDY